jgi:hypothetical protein
MHKEHVVHVCNADVIQSNISRSEMLMCTTQHHQEMLSDAALRITICKHISLLMLDDSVYCSVVSAVTARSDRLCRLSHTVGMVNEHDEVKSSYQCPHNDPKIRSPWSRVVISTRCSRPHVPSRY